jgi:ethanolamine utilization protein EutN
MYIGKVIGNVVATRKDEKLIGSKLLVIKLEEGMPRSARTIVAIDAVGAGKNDRVLICTGSSARYGLKDIESPVDAVVVGIIDDLNS